MPEIIGSLTLVLATNALGMFSPGPDMLLLTRNSAGRAAAPAYATVFGITTGIALHVSLSVAGISGLLLQNPAVFRGFLLLAGLYLLHLGLNGLRGLYAGRVAASRESQQSNRHGDEDGNASAGRDRGVRAAYFEGLLCNVLNVKAAAFFVSLFGLLIGPETTLNWRIAVGVLCVCECLLLWSLFVWLLRRAKRRAPSDELGRWASTAFSGLLIIAGGALLLEALGVFAK